MVYVSRDILPLTECGKNFAYLFFHDRDIKHENTLHDAELLSWLVDVGTVSECREDMLDGIFCFSFLKNLDGLDIIRQQLDNICKSLL